ncbi:hypothetical protein ABPG74_013069 [Tetrahymena malaccensis]
MDQEDIDFSDIEKFLLTHYRKCPIHKRSITYLRLDDKEDPQLIKCFKCMEENKSNNCIDIVELLQSDNHFIFQKWPIHDDDTILKDLQQMKQWPFAQYCEEINLIFDEIIEKVQSKRKEILKDLGQIQENQQKPLDYYKQISQKEKLVNIIKNQFADQKEQNQMILSVIKENEQNYGSNKKQLVDLINEANKHLFDLIEIKNIMDKVLSSINQINRFDNQQDFDGKPVDNNDQNLEEITIYSFVDLNQCWDFQKINFDFSRYDLQFDSLEELKDELNYCQNIVELQLNLYNCHILDEGAIRKVTQPKELLVKKLAMQEINYVNSDDEILSQSCPIHKRKVLYLVLDDKNDPNVLKCIKCFEQQKPLCSILIEDLLQSDDSTIFRNWPFLEGRVTYKKLKQIDEISKWFMDQKEKTVEDLFTDFKSADSLDKQIFIKNLEDLKQCLNYKNINIDFNNNKIQDEGLISLTKSIQNCQNISNLEITKKLTMQEINYVNSDDEILSQSCPIHKRKVAYLVLDDTNDPNVLKCIKCFEQQKPLCSILIEDLLQSDDSTIFRNWPFLEDRVTYKQLKYLDEISKWFMDQKEKTVEDLFTDFKSAVIQKIDTIKKDTLKKLDSINQIKQKTIDLYNQMSFKEELKKILRIRALGEDEVKIKNAKILNIINENMQKYQQNYQELSIQIDNAIQYNFNLTLYHNKTKEALSQIDQIDFFQDSLDKEIHIKNLEDLKYEKNLNDSDIKTIGEVLKDCNEITTLQLHLSQNNIGDEGITNITNEVQKHKNINKFLLNLNNNKIGLKGVETLANTLELFQNINELQLSLNDIHVGDEGAVSITNAISQHKDIYYLHFNLRNCQINSLGVKVLVKSIENYRKLRYLGLNLCNNNIGIEGTDYIAKGLKKQQNLTHLVLWLDSNKLGDEGVSKISNAIIQYQNITVLQLSFADNNVSNKGVQQLAQALQNFKKLTELQIYLENNKFQDEGLVYLAKSLQNYQNISILKLVLSSNKIGDEGISKISNAITQYQNIRQLQLYFDDNDVSSKGVQQLAQALQNFKKLTILIIDLDNNKIQDEGLISLTKSIQNCQNISNLEISLGANQTSQPGAQYFADILYKFEKLTQLTLYFDYDQIGVEGALSIINNLEKINSIKKFVFALSYRSSVFWVIKMLEFIINKVTLGLEEDVEIMNDDNFNKSNEDNDDFLNNVNQDGYDEEINYHDQDYDNTLCNIILKTKILIKFDFYWDQQSEYYY